MIGRNQVGIFMRAFIAVALVAASACMPHKSIQVLQPSVVRLPDDITRLAVLDRSRPADSGEAVLGALEGILTGEGIVVDRDAAHWAVKQVTEALATSPRYDVVTPIASDRYTDSSIFDSQLAWGKAAQICEDVDAQALVSLESIDSDSYISWRTGTETREEDGTTYKQTYHYADRYTTVTLAWRVYYPAGGIVFDDTRDLSSTYTSSAKGNSRREALERLPSVRADAITLGAMAGAAYGQRIAPYYQTIHRAYFKSAPDPRFKTAFMYAKHEQWVEAVDTWLSIAQDETADPVSRGKASYNVSVGYEIGGYYTEAREFAQDAVNLLGNKKAFRRMRQLDDAMRRDEAVESQMAPVQ